MKKILASLAISFLSLLILGSGNSVFAAGWNNGGYYINLYGGLNSHSGSFCNPSTGECKWPNGGTGHVEEYVCTGKYTNCDNGHGAPVVGGYPQYSTDFWIIANSYVNQCGYTIQLDVFNSAPSANANPLDFMTWYSGDCSAPAPVQVTVCTGETMTEDRMDQLLQGAGYGGPWDLSSALAAYNRAACPAVVPTSTPMPTPTPIIVTPTPTPAVVYVTPTPTPTQAPIGGANSLVSCPAGTSQYLSGSTVICMSQSANAQTGPINVTNTNNNSNIVNPAQPIVVTQPQPQVVYVSGATGVTTLPKTGMPVEAWGLTGFFPVGIWLRKFASSKKALQSSANYLWNQRQFLKK